MTENMKKLLELASNNPELQEKLSNSTKENIIVLAKEVGVSLTEADFEALQGEIGDDELDAVAGGDKCYCFAGGGSSRVDERCHSKTCVCVGGGSGRTGGGASRCTCVGAGFGYDILSKA